MKLFTLISCLLFLRIKAFTSPRTFSSIGLQSRTIGLINNDGKFPDKESRVCCNTHPSFIPIIRRGSITLFPYMRRYVLMLYSMIGSMKDAISLKNFLSTKRIGKKIFCIFLAFLSITLIRDVLATRSRQQNDATSEWGRYADNPSLRGLALSLLIVRLATYMLIARLFNLMPGGERYPLRKLKKQDQHGNHSRWAAEKSADMRIRCGKIFAENLLRLGPLYIKIGQILSCRENLLPEEWKAPMERLQDQVPAKSGNDALELAYSAYEGGEQEFKTIFSYFNDEPLAAASLGQVHLATLKSSNETVALKLQRPRLKDIYDKDLMLMKKIATTVDRFGASSSAGGVKQSWEEIFNDTEKILYREIDYRKEAENAIRFASDFGLGKGGLAAPGKSTSLDGKELPSAASWIRTPYVYDELSNERCLVMEYVPSIKISRDDELTKVGLNFDDKVYLADCLARAYLRQFVCGKFFSTDPHPGNLGVELIPASSVSKESVRLVFYDFGQACSLRDEQALGILHVIEGIVDMNVDNCVDAFIQMGVLSPDADLDKVRSKIKDNFETGKVKVKRRKKRMDERYKSAFEPNMISAEVNTTEYIKVVGNMTEGKVEDSEIVGFFTLPAEYAFVARAISQMDGVGKGLDKEFDFISAAAPYLVEIKGSELYLQDEAKKIFLSGFKKLLDLQNQLFDRIQVTFESIHRFQQDLYEKIKNN